MPTRAALVVLRKNLAAAVALAATLVLAPLLAFSETTVKGILDRWLSQCVLVLDSETRADGAVMIRLHTFGEMPKTLPITVVARTGKVDRITLLNHVEPSPTRAETNLLVHPQANQRCPGALCDDQPVAAERLTFRITPMSPNYLYRFNVLTSDLLSHEHLTAYVRPLKGEEVICRVERATLANFVARQPRETQLLIFSIGVVLVTLLITYLRRKPEGENVEKQPTRRTLRPSDMPRKRH
jgi:hypothetical protein